MKGFIVVHCSNDILGDYEVIVNLSTIRNIETYGSDEFDQSCIILFDKEVVYHFGKYKCKCSTMNIKETFSEVIQLIEEASK